MVICTDWNNTYFIKLLKFEYQNTVLFIDLIFWLGCYLETDFETGIRKTIK